MSLRRGKTNRLVFGLAEQRILLEENMENTFSLDVSVQLNAAILLFAATGARPGSMLKIPEYKTYLQVKDIQVIRERREEDLLPGQPEGSPPPNRGFALKVTLSDFKGYNTSTKLEVTFIIGTTGTITERSLIYDTGLAVVASFFRRGFFGDLTAEKVWDGPEEEVSIDEKFLELPVFVAVNNGGYCSER